MENDQLTSDNMQLNDVPPDGFCDEPFILSNEVKALRREVNAMKEAMVRLISVLQGETAKKVDEAPSINSH